MYQALHSGIGHTMTVVVAFVSRKGGVGKSTLARSLAAVAARRGLNATLADLDRDQQTSIRWQRLREGAGVFPPLTVQRYGNVDSAIASEPDADLLIIDAPGNTPELTTEIASVAHLVVQPSGASFDDLQPAVELFYELNAAGVPKSRLFIALSRLLDPQRRKRRARMSRLPTSTCFPEPSSNVRGIARHTAAASPSSRAPARILADRPASPSAPCCPRSCRSITCCTSNVHSWPFPRRQCSSRHHASNVGCRATASPSVDRERRHRLSTPRSCARAPPSSQKSRPHPWGGRGRLQRAASTRSVTARTCT